ncbi:MAG: VCBS repeat-containing protein [Planctomycetes bacterium]|nr:VCBS repeat-containing protein [Planctomycetota bacterium]
MRNTDNKTVRSLLLVIVAFCSAASTGFAQDLYPGAQYPLGGSPLAMASADFNQDGRADFAATTVDASGAHRVAVLLALASGGFAPASNYAQGSGVSPLSIGDMNNDGALDIVSGVAGSAGAFVILFNNGSGAFPTSLTNALPMANISSIDLVNMNADGLLDTVTTHLLMVGANVGITYNAGGGVSAGTVTANGGTFPAEAATADFDNNGFADIAVANKYSNIAFVPGSLAGAIPYIPGNTASILYSTAAGVGAATAYTVDLGPANLFAGDVNADGNADFISANVYMGFNVVDLIIIKSISPIWNSTFTIAIGGGNQQFSPILTFSSLATPVSMDAGDFNRDGFTDLLTASTGVAPWSPLVTFLDANGFVGGQYSLNAGFYAAGALFSDINHDSKLDIIEADLTTKAFEIAIGDGNGAVLTPPVLSYNLSIANGAHDFRVADVNGDGAPDLLVMLDKNLDVSVFLGDGAGGFQLFTDVIVSPGAGQGNIAVADLNNDGKPDFAAVSVVAQLIKTYFGAGDGNFTFAQNVLPGPPPPGTIQRGIPRIADLNLDGTPDLVVGRRTIEVYLNHGGVLTTAPSPVVAIQGPVNIEVADFNSDGVPDILTTIVTMYPGVGDGTFSAPVTIDMYSGTQKQVRNIAAEDFNKDGVIDFAVVWWQDQIGGFVRAYHGTGGGAFSQGADVPVGITNAASISIADADRDGNFDVVLGDLIAETVLLVPGNADGGLSNPNVQFTSSQPRWLETADFNSDGKIDIATVSTKLSIYINSGFDAVGPAIFGTGTPGCAGRLGASATSTPTVGNANFSIYVTNAPPDALGVALFGENGDLVGVDYFGINALIHVDPYNSPGLFALDIYTNHHGEANLGVPIPNDPGLHGYTTLFQCIFIENAANGQTCSPALYDIVTSRGLGIPIQ